MKISFARKEQDIPLDLRERCPRQRKARNRWKLNFSPEVARPHGPQIHKIQYATRASRLPAMEWGRLCDDVSGVWKSGGGDVGKGRRSGGREPQTGYRFIVYIEYVPFLRRASRDQLLLHIPFPFPTLAKTIPFPLANHPLTPSTCLCVAACLPPRYI